MTSNSFFNLKPSLTFKLSIHYLFQIVNFFLLAVKLRYVPNEKISV